MASRSILNKDHPLYYTWRSMKQRCYNPNCYNFEHWGGRGIKVCDRWRDNFKQFAADMGARPEGMWLERIDNDGDYTPDNTYNKGLDFIDESTLDPAKAITEGYETYVVINSEGRQTIGLKTREDGGEIDITKATGDVVTIATTDIKEITQDATVSVMPDDMSTSIEGFSIAGEDGKFYLAHATWPFTKDQGVWNTANKSYDATKVILWSPLVAEPVAVRYGWADNPDCNLAINSPPS